MRAAYGVAAVRAAEKRALAALPAGTLMDRAAAALARRCRDLLGGSYGRRVLLLVGSGDNGGDALLAGALLAERGAAVDAVPVGGRHHEPAAARLLRAGGRMRELGELSALLAAAELVVDGMTGIGGKGSLRGGAAKAAAAIDGGPALVVAVDVPSGVDADSGQVAGVAVRADVTVTFGALKPGLLVDPGHRHAGVVECVDIGLDVTADPVLRAVDASDVDGWLAVPAPEADKYARGVVGVVAGSPQYAGAAVLAVGGAVVAGAGIVRFVGPPEVATLVRSRWPEAVVESGAGAAGVHGSGRVQAWVVGPGLGPDQEAAVAAVLNSGLPAVVDADAVSALAAHPPHERVLVTPHAGELARALGVDRAEVEARRLEHAEQAAQGWGCAVLLKGATTLVAASSSAPLVTATAPSWTATAGAGDVLAGAAGALLAGGLPAQEAGAAAAFVHGVAAGIAAEGDAPVRASDLLERWADAVRAVRD